MDAGLVMEQLQRLNGGSRFQRNGYLRVRQSTQIHRKQQEPNYMSFLLACLKGLTCLRDMLGSDGGYHDETYLTQDGIVC